MARAETVETVGEHEAVGNGPLPCHNTCRTEVPRPLLTWPRALVARPRSAGGGPGVVRHLEPFRVLNLSCPLASPRPGGQEELRGARPSSPPPPPTPGSDRRSRGTEAQRDSSAEPSDSRGGQEKEDQQDSGGPGPLPDLLPHTERPSRAAARPDVSRVASQLRCIGDAFNAAALRRTHGAPHWQDWRDVCRGLLSFITQTLSRLYGLA